MTARLPARDRRLVLHIGATKTGTSALQVALVRNRRKLQEMGILYPQSESDRAAEQGKITSGNGLAIASFLNPKLPFSQRFARPDYLTEMFSEISVETDADSVLFSSEHIGFFIDERLRSFVDAAQQYGYTMEIVYFVRNVLDHAYSAYNQGVKRHRMGLDFETYIRDKYKCPFAGTLSRLNNLVEKDRIYVLSYDRVKPYLLKSMLEALAFATEGIVESTGVINRSLTRHEIEIMRFVIPYLRDDNECRKISDALIYAKEALEEKPTISRQILAFVEARFQPDLDFVNRFAGQPLLATAAEGKDRAAPPDLDSELPLSIAERVESILKKSAGVAGPNASESGQPCSIAVGAHGEIVRSSALAAAATLSRGRNAAAPSALPAARFLALMLSNLEARVAQPRMQA